MSIIFTMYNHGSGWNRDKGQEEIVTFLGARAVGTEYRNFLITDGVGSVPTTEPMAGTFIPEGHKVKRLKTAGYGYNTRDVKEQPMSAGMEFKADMMTLLPTKALVGSDLKAILLGTGVDDNATQRSTPSSICRPSRGGST